MSSLSAITIPNGTTYDLKDAAALRSAAAAPAFSSESAYSEGDYVTHEGLLYRATAARVAGVWNSGSGFEVFPLWKKANLYPFVTVAVSSGTVTLQPFANNQMDLSAESGATAFAVAFAASPVSGTMRDLWFVVKMGLLSPTVTWPSGVVAADDNGDNLVVDANATLAFHIVECAAGVFLVFKQVLESRGVQLPYDAEVEYLESTGTQYIDTGVVSSGIDVKCLMVFTDNSVANQGVLGSRAKSGDTGSNAYQIWYNVSANKLRLDWASYTKSADVSLDTPVRIEAYHNGSVFVNGTEYTGNAKTANAYNIYICNFNQGGVTGATGCRAKVYSFQILNNNTLVRDFIPVRVGSGANAVGYLYDRANPTGGPYGNGLYDNSGTGSFTIGPDKT